MTVALATDRVGHDTFLPLLRFQNTVASSNPLSTHTFSLEHMMSVKNTMFGLAMFDTARRGLIALSLSILSIRPYSKSVPVPNMTIAEHVKMYSFLLYFFIVEMPYAQMQNAGVLGRTSALHIDVETKLLELRLRFGALITALMVEVLLSKLVRMHLSIFQAVRNGS